MRIFQSSGWRGKTAKAQTTFFAERKIITLSGDGTGFGAGTERGMRQMESLIFLGALFIRVKELEAEVIVTIWFIELKTIEFFARYPIDFGSSLTAQ